MRIALIGASGTGKTTLAGAISKRTGTPIVPEGVRELCKEWGIKHLSELRKNKDDYFAFQTELVNRKMAFEMSHDDFIADRAYIDNLAYHMYWGARKSGNDQNEAYKKLCVTGMYLYDLVVFVPLGKIPYVCDGFRTKNKLYNEAMERLIYAIMELDCRNEYMVLQSIDIEDRVEEVIKVYEGIMPSVHCGEDH